MLGGGDGEKLTGHIWNLAAHDEAFVVVLEDNQTKGTPQFPLLDAELVGAGGREVEAGKHVTRHHAEHSLDPSLLFSDACILVPLDVFEFVDILVAFIVRLDSVGLLEQLHQPALLVFGS